jgi:hypothetical protein
MNDIPGPPLAVLVSAFRSLVGLGPKLADPLERYLLVLFCARSDSDRIEWFSRAA